MGLHRTDVLALILGLAALASPLGASDQKTDAKPKKPSLSLRASPNVGFAPLRVVFTAELSGGPNDYEEYYCPAIEWNWGDDTESQDFQDCEPYVAGKSEIKRTYTAEHKYQSGGEYTVNFRLKRGDRIVAAVSTMLRIRPGLREIGN